MRLVGKIPTPVRGTQALSRSGGEGVSILVEDKANLGMQTV